MPSSDDKREDAGDLPRTTPTSKESLEEFRRIRRQQDEEYALSLRTDQLKVNFRCMQCEHYAIIVFVFMKEKQKEDKVCIYEVVDCHMIECIMMMNNVRNWRKFKCNLETRCKN